LVALISGNKNSNILSKQNKRKKNSKQSEQGENNNKQPSQHANDHINHKEKTSKKENDTPTKENFKDGKFS